MSLMDRKNLIRGAFIVLTDLAPVGIFVAAFHLARARAPDAAIFIAAAAYAAATIAAIGWAIFRGRKPPPLHFVAAAMVVLFTGLAIAFNDEAFIKVKPTIDYLAYAAGVFGSMAFGVNVWKVLFGHAFTLPDRIWRLLAMRWGFFFLFMAVVNELIRQTQTTEFWVNARLLIAFPLVLTFMLINLPVTLKNISRE